MSGRLNGKRHRPYYEEIYLEPCPKCGRVPKIKIDYGSYETGHSAWVDISCRRWYEYKPHISLSIGRASLNNALKVAIEEWNKMAKEKW